MPSPSSPFRSRAAALLVAVVSLVACGKREGAASSVAPQPAPSASLANASGDGAADSASDAATSEDFFSLRARPLGERDEVSFARHAGHVLLVVNVASSCGYTPQYAGLQSLQSTYGARGFEVVAFPCNQFGEQEPGDADEIRKTGARYGATFPLYEKIEVNGAARHPVYRWLLGQPGAAGDIPWNFTKFVIGRNGAVVRRFPPDVEPLSPKIVATIEQALAT